MAEGFLRRLKIEYLHQSQKREKWQSRSIKTRDVALARIVFVGIAFNIRRSECNCWKSRNSCCKRYKTSFVGFFNSFIGSWWVIVLNIVYKIHSRYNYYIPLCAILVILVNSYEKRSVPVSEFFPLWYWIQYFCLLPTKPKWARFFIISSV